MWTKLNIFKECNLNNCSFYLNRIKKQISNCDETIIIKFPFDLYDTDFYNYELSYNNQYIELNLLLFSDKILQQIRKNEFFSTKNNIFKVLSYYVKNRKNKIDLKFNTYSNVDKSIKQMEDNITNHNILKIDKLYYDLDEEKIFIYKKNISTKYKSNFLFLFSNCINNISSIKKLCVIDKKKNLKNIPVLDKNTFYDYSLNSLQKLNIVGIDINFLLSNKYLDIYTKFHNNHRSYQAYNNLKSFIKTTNDVPANIELMDDFNIIIFNLDLVKIMNHPILYSNSKIIVSNEKIKASDLPYIKKIITCNNNEIREISSNFLNNHIFIDNSKKYLINKYIYSKTIKVNQYTFNNIKTTINKFTDKNEKICPINNEKIEYESYCVFNCGHCFKYKNFWKHLNNNHNCPYCSVQITNLNIYLHNDDLLFNYFGDQFKNLLEKMNYEFSGEKIKLENTKKYDKYEKKLLELIYRCQNIEDNIKCFKDNYSKSSNNKQYNYLYLYKSLDIRNQFIKDNLNINSINLTTEEDITIYNNTIILIDDNIDIYDIINLKINTEIKLLCKIVKLSSII